MRRGGRNRSLFYGGKFLTAGVLRVLPLYAHFRLLFSLTLCHVSTIWYDELITLLILSSQRNVKHMVIKAQSPAGFAEEYIIESIWNNRFPWLYFARGA